jgi:hypothetical protein
VKPFHIAFSVLVACGGARTDTGSSAPASPIASAASDAGAAAPSAERPVAKDTGDAVRMISEAVDERKEGMAGCVREYRFRKHLAHAKVEVQIGIDQDGRILGVTSKGKEDKELFRCVQNVLKDATFPRSKAGVITITKSYEEIVQ